MADVFLSYTHSDQKIAELVAHRLAESGWATWWDRELLAGERYRTETQHQLDDARCVLVLWSKAALTSRWVLDEADAGANNDRLVQILLEELELPLGFRNVQHVVMSAQDLSGDLFQRLAAAITKKVTPTGADHFAPARIKTITELREALNTLALHASQDELPKSREHVQRLETEFAAKWADIGSVNEAFGRAWASAGDISRAAGYYAAALDAPDSSASFAAAEQLANMRIRLAFADVPAGEAKARQSIHEAIALLNRMSAVRTGHVAEALTANAYKRLAILEAGIGNAAQEAKALAAMEKHFAAAEQIGLVQNLPGLYYTTLNKMSASLAQPRRGTSRRQLEAEDISRARKEIEAINRDKPDFWSLVSSIELTVYEAVDAGALSKRAPTIVAAYHDLKRLTESRGMWKSVYDSASFVLSRYSGRARPAEKRATEIVLAALKGAAEPA